MSLYKTKNIFIVALGILCPCITINYADLGIIAFVMIFVFLNAI